MKEISGKQKLIFFVVVLVLLITMVTMIKNWPKDDGEKIIDYANTNFDTLITDSVLNTDSGIYWSLNEIVLKYLNSYLVENEVGKKSKYTNYKGYYNNVVQRYKRYLGKSKYEKLSSDFCSRFVVSKDNNKNFAMDGIGDYNNIDSEKIIRNVYVFEENRYICKLYSSKNDKTGYIGIELNPKELTWKIFYIE